MTMGRPRGRWAPTALLVLFCACCLLLAVASSDAATTDANAPLRPPAADASADAVLERVGVHSMEEEPFASTPASARNSAHRSSSSRAEAREAARRHRQSLHAQAQALYEAAEAARGARDGATALRLYRQAAELKAGAGSAAALSTLARMHQLGWDGEADLVEVHMPNAPAVKGRLRRLLNLSGSSYLARISSNSTASTLLVPPSVPEAVRLWRAAAELGNATAQFILGALHAHGLFGVPLDSAQAITLYSFAARGGSHEARLALAHRHHWGSGVPKDCAASVTHYLPPALAAAAAAESTRGLGLPGGGQGVAALPHRDRLSDEVLEALAFDSHKGGMGADTGMLTYYHNVAEKGDAQAHVALGHLYLLGARGVERNYAAAAEHFLAAAEHNDTLSLANLGYLYMHGLGVEQDYALAAAFVKEPAEAGMASALNTLGVLTVKGWGVPQDVAAGYALLKRAAENGFPDGAYNMALMHAAGTAPSGRDFRTSLQYMRLAASAGHLPALVRLARMQIMGIGGPKDCAAAQSSLHSAINRSPTTSASIAHGYRLLAAGNPAAALVEYIRGSEVGIETGAWNAAYLLQEGLVPEAAGGEARVATGADAPSATATTPAAAIAAMATRPWVMVDATDAHEAALAAGAAVDGKGAAGTAAVSTSGAGATEGIRVPEVAVAAVGQAASAAGAGGAAAQASVPGDAASDSSRTGGNSGSGAAGVAGQGSSAVPGPTPTKPPVRSKAGEVAGGGEGNGGAPAPAADSSMLSSLSSLSSSRSWFGPSVADTLRLWQGLVFPKRVHATDASIQRLALRLYQRSSSQGNGEAELAIGDYHFYGHAGLNASAERATEYYRQACGHHVAQACFNLGWAHETGQGAPSDAHLAKRYYDTTLEEQRMGRSAASSYVPVKMALWRLQAKDSIVWWRDTLVRPCLSLVGLGGWADVANGVLSLPAYVPKPPAAASTARAGRGKAGAGKAGQKAGAGGSGSKQGRQQSKAEAGASASAAGEGAVGAHGTVVEGPQPAPEGYQAAAAAATASASPSSSPSPTPTPSPLDPRARVKAALEQSRASRQAKARESSVLAWLGETAAGYVEAAEDAFNAGLDLAGQASHALLNPLASLLGVRAGLKGVLGAAGKGSSSSKAGAAVVPVEELTPGESLMVLGCLLFLGALTLRALRLRREALDREQGQPEGQLEAAGGR